MRCLLISANTEKMNMPTLPMGLGCVAAALEAADHEVRFLDLMAKEDWQSALREALAEPAPDVIGISIRNIDDQVSGSPRFLLEKARDVVVFCRAHAHAPIVLGGAGYSIFPQAVLDYTGADMGIQGEGEQSFSMLLERLERSASPADVPGLAIRGKGLQAPGIHVRDLDRFPLPGPDLFDSRFARDPDYFLPIQTRRGCPLNCSYCSTSTIEGRLIRRRSPATVIDALHRWRAASYSRIFFVDNVFNLPNSYASDLCARMAGERLDIQWRAILYPGQVTETLVRSMARAGCRDVSLGFESGSQPILDGLHKRFSPEDVRRTSRLLADAGIGSMGFLLLGGPGETRETVLESLSFADSLGLNAIKLTIGPRIYPYTELARIAVREGLIEPEADLLSPVFYIARGLEAWLRETVQSWISHRPHWML
ncbi:B12-binding domain-containing radical SAM protein [uncultured Desulfosarcina sp.]|uniref:B12-binding domain-containing radical SAM protein n=1 Tax=uncultured Desulfosarcina sp. TaxID=218289 RepID=UPI0029C60718|nr:radical SAM protein [uncultured Desulfosarcina sp.]